MPGNTTESNMADLVGNMVSIPVMMGITMSVFAALSWVCEPATTASAHGPVEEASGKAIDDDMDAAEEFPCAESQVMHETGDDDDSLFTEWERGCAEAGSPHHDEEHTVSAEGLMQGGPVLIPGILSQVYRAGNSDEHTRQIGSL